MHVHAGGAFSRGKSSLMKEALQLASQGIWTLALHQDNIRNFPFMFDALSRAQSVYRFALAMCEGYAARKEVEGRVHGIQVIAGGGET